MRKYHLHGTNGQLFANGDLVCFTIELPWKDNTRKKSCIPEGIYGLVKRYSVKFGWHMMLTDVKDRSLILIHPANNALKELMGCIAPVTAITGEGTGHSSKKAFAELKFILFPLLNTNQELKLKITS